MTATSGGGPRVVVVGAGIGGLSAAIHLAASGHKVEVLERAPRVGGKMREVTAGGRVLDAGPTVLTMRWVLDDLFAVAGQRLDDHLTLRAAEVLARHAWSGGARLDLYADMDRSAEAIGALAGAREAEGYRAFCGYARRMYEAVEGPFLRAPAPSLRAVLATRGLRGLAALGRIDGTRTLWKALGDFFRDPRLRQLFARYATYAGSSPFLAPATLAVIAHVEREGVFTVEGGMYRLAEALAKLAVALGVDIRCNATVTEVLVHKHRGTGVLLSTGEVLPSDAVVVNADTAALGAGCLGTAARAAAPGAHRVARSLSAMTWAVTARTRGFPLVRHNVFFSDDYAAEFRDLAADALPMEPTVYVCAQDRDGRDGGKAIGEETDGPERLLLIVNAPARGGRGSFTRTETDACEQRTRSLLARRGLTIDTPPWTAPRTTPGTAPGTVPDQAVMATPDDFERMFPGTGGGLYGGATHGWRASLVRPTARSEIPGIYLAGGSTHPGAGVPMAALSGRHAAASVREDLALTGRWSQAVMRGGTSTP